MRIVCRTHTLGPGGISNSGDYGTRGEECRQLDALSADADRGQVVVYVPLETASWWISPDTLLEMWLRSRDTTI